MKKLRIAVLGDSHGQIKNIGLLTKYLGNVDYVIHTGDYFTDALYIGKNHEAKVIGVRGNCDFGSLGKDEVVEVIGDKRFFITHGHQYGIKYDLNRIFYRGKELQADIVLFGHSHVPHYSIVDGMVLLNPGSISLPRGGSSKSFAIISIENGDVSIEVIDLE